MIGTLELYRTGYIYKGLDTVSTRGHTSTVLLLERTQLRIPGLIKPREAPNVVTLDLLEYLEGRADVKSFYKPVSKEVSSFGRDLTIVAETEAGKANFAVIKSRERGARLEIVFPQSTQQFYPDFPDLDPADPSKIKSVSQNPAFDYGQIFKYTEWALEQGLHLELPTDITKIRRRRRRAIDTL